MSLSFFISSSSFTLGLFQYGDLHFGQTAGVSLPLRGTQACQHRSHCHPVSFTLAMSK